MNQLESINCPVCLAPFGATKNIPKIFPTCGHTICEDCLVTILKKNNPKCPLDKKDFGWDFRSIEAFPTNLLGKDLLAKNDKGPKCPVHPQEQNKVICLTDHTLICTDCVIFGDHKDHEVRSLSEAQDLAKSKQTRLSEILNKITTNQTQVNTSIHEKQKTIKEAIKERFGYLHSVINKHEAQMLFKLENMIMEEKIKLENGLLNRKATDIKNILDEFSKLMVTPDILKVLNEDFQELDKIMTDEFSLTSQKIEEFHDLIKTFENSLPREDLLNDLNISNILNQNLTKFQEKRRFGFEEGIKEAKEIVVSSSGLRFNFLSDEVFEIRDYNSKSTETIERSKLDKIEEIVYHLSLRGPNEEDDENEEDKVMPALMKLSKFLPNVKTVKFNLSGGGYKSQYDKRFRYILSATLSQPENIQKLFFNFKDCEIGGVGITFLAENVFPRIKDLRTFSLIVKKTVVSSSMLKALAKANFKAWENFETFRLDILGASLKENDIAEFLNSLPNVKDLLLGFGDCEVNDKSIETFSTKVLPSLDRLERFEVGFWGAKLTNIGVERFLMNLPKIKTFLVGLNRTEITEDIVKVFLEKKLPEMTQLFEFRLGVSKENLSESIINQIDEWQDKIDDRNENFNYLPRPLYETWREPRNIAKLKSGDDPDERHAFDYSY